MSHSNNKISREAADAFKNGTPYKNANTLVTISNDVGVAELWLHNHLIAWRSGDALTVSFRGWPTRTTIARINAVLEALNIRGSYGTMKGELVFRTRNSEGKMTVREVDCHAWERYLINDEKH